MNSFRRAVYKVGLIEEELIREEKVIRKEASCDNFFRVDGSAGIYEADIFIGTDVGEMGINYEAHDAPDRFQIFFDGELVADSKFVGDSLNTTKEDLLRINKSFKIFSYNGEEFVDSGESEVINITESDIAGGGGLIDFTTVDGVVNVLEPTQGRGSLKFNKSKSTVTKMTLRVIGVLGVTLWNATPICQETPSSGGGSSAPSARTYDLMYHNYITSAACFDLENGVPTKYYSKDTLKVGTKLYLNRQLTKLAPSGHVFLGRTIYDLFDGEITDIYPCHKGLGI